MWKKVIECILFLLNTSNFTEWCLLNFGVGAHPPPGPYGHDGTDHRATNIQLLILVGNQQVKTRDWNRG